MFQIGEPRVGISEPESGMLIVAQTVVSVGPYALIMRRPSDHRATSAPGQASPATISPSRSRPALSPRVASTMGGKVACVTLWAVMTSRSAGPARSSSGTSTSLAPTVRAMAISDNDASKLRDANCNTLDWGVMPSRSTWAAASVGIPACATITPLGVPEEPEV